jgi:putative tryptophan/tyrosine transport system substrate-binding protein
MIQRRAFMAGVAAPMAEAQQVGKVWRIGVVSPGGGGPAYAAFEQSLPQYGWFLGQNIVLEYRFARGDLNQIPSFVVDLLRRPVDLLIASSAALPASTAATRTVPIIMAFAVDDPVEAGWVVSLARPGGNVTGVTLYAPELTAKRLEVLKSAVTIIKRVAVLSWRGPGSSGQINAAKAAAASLGLEHHVVTVAAASEYDEAFAAVKRCGLDALLVLSTGAFFHERRRIADLALKHRLPMIAPFREVAESGGLLAYGPNVVVLWRDRVPVYVDQILRGARPADLPIEQPRQYFDGSHSWPHHPALAAAAGGSGDRVMDRRRTGRTAGRRGLGKAELSRQGD